MPRLSPVARHAEMPVDTALSSKIAAGDREAFARLFELHHRRLYGVCKQLLGDRSLAEDAVQESFARTLATLSRFDESRDAWPWIRTIAERVCIDMQRRGARLASLDKMIETEPEEPPRPLRRPGDAVLDEIIRSEGRRKLEDALKSLPSRQRRALLLYALEDWEYGDIAGAESISLLATKSLIFRARAALRKSCSLADMTPAIFPLMWLRAKRAGEKVSRQASRVASIVAVPQMNNLVGGLAIVMCLAITQAPVVAPDSPTHRTVAAVDTTDVVHAVGGTSDTGDVATDGGRRSIIAAGGDLGGAIIDPTKDATPERTQFTSIVPSPDYEHDHTVYAAGTVGCYRPPCSVLFRSTDGAASWQRVSDSSFSGKTIVLSPRFAHDHRMFAMGRNGLLESVDGGATFTQVLPVSGHLAISPLFGSGDDTVLIGSSTVLAYDAKRRVVEPSAGLSVYAAEQTVAYSPGYADDQMIAIGAMTLRPGAYLWESVVRRCVSVTCRNDVLGGATGVPSMRPVQTIDGPRWYAFTAAGVYVASDLSNGFGPVDVPVAGRAVSDVANLFAGSDDDVLFISFHSSPKHPGVLLRSTDGGESWLDVSPPSLFDIGIASIQALPDGRVIAASASKGIVCSVDRGKTWSPRCASTV
jgi:RNA polymerase sigma-70 factor, ECF subfamily